MPTVVTNPLSGLIDGMLQGYGLGMQIKHQKMQEEAHQRAMAAADREAQINAIRDQNFVQENSRPASAGIVQDMMSPAPVPSGGPMGDVTKNLFPQMEGGEPQIPIARPVDKSRRFKFNGEERELYTPDEQIKRQIDRAQQMKHADAVPIQTPQHLRDLGLPETIWVPNDHLTQYAETTGQMAPVDTPSEYQQLGGRPTVPQRMMPSVISTVNAAENRRAADTRATNANATREKIATDNRVSADKRAANSNATRLQAASIRRDQPTANAQGVQNRFQQRQLEADQKELRALEIKEAALHAKKTEEGQTSPADPKNGEAFAKQREGKLKALDLQIKGIQESKKKLIDKWQPKGGMPQQTTAAPRPRATNPKTGEVVEFDGTKWVSVSGN